MNDTRRLESRDEWIGTETGRAEDVVTSTVSKMGPAYGTVDSNAAARTMLRQVRIRPTRQRILLARILFDGRDRHVTAELLHSEAVAKGGTISLATIYNTLHQFCAAGLLREVALQFGQTYFDTNVSDHHHVYIEGEGNLRDIPGDGITVTGLPAAPDGYAVDRVDIVVRWSAVRQEI